MSSHHTFHGFLLNMSGINSSSMLASMGSFFPSLPSISLPSISFPSFSFPVLLFISRLTTQFFYYTLLLSSFFISEPSANNIQQANYNQAATSMAPRASKRSTKSKPANEGVKRSMARPRKGQSPTRLHIVCPGCGLIYQRRCDFTKHYKVHTRPHKCPIDGCRFDTDGFPSKREMERHMNDKHAVNPQKVKCEHCGYVSKRTSNMKQHLENSHGILYERTKGKNASPSLKKASPSSKKPIRGTRRSASKASPTTTTTGNSTPDTPALPTPTHGQSFAAPHDLFAGHSYDTPLIRANPDIPVQADDQGLKLFEDLSFFDGINTAVYNPEQIFCDDNNMEWIAANSNMGCFPPVPAPALAPAPADPAIGSMEYNHAASMFFLDAFAGGSSPNYGQPSSFESSPSNMQGTDSAMAVLFDLEMADPLAMSSPDNFGGL